MLPCAQAYMLQLELQRLHVEVPQVVAKALVFFSPPMPLPSSLALLPPCHVLERKQLLGNHCCS